VKPRRDSGFTLLEVTVAMAVLALGLVAVVDINAGAARLHEASQQLTVGTLLARSKMIDLEQKLNEEGFSDFDTQLDGVFDTEGHSDFRWHAEILKPDLTKTSEQLTTMVTGALGGGATSGQSGGGLAGFGGGALAGLLGQSSLLPADGQLPLGVNIPSSGSSSSASSPTSAGLSGLLGGAASGLIQSQVDMLVQQLQKGVREVRLNVYWPEGKNEGSLSIATHLIVLNATGAGTSSGLPTGQGTATGTGSAPGTAAGLPGAPGAPGAPGLPGFPGGGFPGSNPLMGR
jgi:general secretion pathway protein I